MPSSPVGKKRKGIQYQIPSARSQTTKSTDAKLTLDKFAAVKKVSFISQYPSSDDKFSTHITWYSEEALKVS